MTTQKPGKKGTNRQQNLEQIRRQHVDRQLFTLDYLYQTMNYITYNNQSLSSQLEIDNNILNRVISEDVKKLGLHFIQRIKSMKQPCDQNIFLNDLQEHGDFVNYDLPRSYLRDLAFIQSQLKQQIQTDMAAKRLRKRYPNIGSRLKLNEVNKLNNKLKEEILNSLMNNLQLIPQENQTNLEKNPLYRELFLIENPMKNGNDERPFEQNISSQQGISNKIRAAQRSQMKNQNADSNKIKKITKGPKKYQFSNQQPEEYVPKINKKLKIDQNPMIITKPVIKFPQINPVKTEKQAKLQANSVLLGQMAEIDKKQTKYSNNILPQDINKSLGSQNDAIQLKRQKISDQQNVVSNTGTQQRVKRKYNKTPKQQKGDEPKKTKKIQKESKQKRQYHKRQKKSEDQQTKKKKQRKITQQKKPEFQAHLVPNPLHTNTLPLKNQPKQEFQYVSIAIQTFQKQENSEIKNKIKQQYAQHAAPANTQKESFNIFQSIKIQQYKQDKQDKNHLNPSNSIIGKSSIPDEFSSFLIINQSVRQSINIPLQENVVQRSPQSSNPFHPDNHPGNLQQLQNNSQQNQIQEEKELDIGEFLN